jgi:perosamine synthetase
MIRLARPSVDNAEIEAVSEVLRSGWLVQGTKVAEFEAALSRRLVRPHCVAYSSGTAALHGALVAVGVRPGDLVIVPAYSWPATANVVELCGAQPVFVDVDPSTLSMEPSALAKGLKLIRRRSARGSLRAIMAVHPFGVIDAIDEIRELSQAQGTVLIEDAACAIGTLYDGKYCGSWGELCCLSFHPRKVVTTGEGGAVLTADSNLARRLRAFRNHGLDPNSSKPEFWLTGANYRLTEMQAAMGIAQLLKLDAILAARRALCQVYDSLLRGSPVKTQTYDQKRCLPNYQSYIVLLPEGCAASKFVAQMREHGVETSIGTWHIPLVQYYRERYGYRPGDFPGADNALARALALPLSPNLTRDEQEIVVDAVMNVIHSMA